MAFSEYILKLNLAIMAGWLLYRFVFRRLTFFQWNRFYLLGSLVLSFILPLLRLPRGSRLAAVADLSGIEWEYMDSLVLTPVPLVPEGIGISTRSLILGIYFALTFLLMTLFIWRFLKNRSLTRNAVRVKGEGIKVFVLDERGGSFTFLRRVYLDRYTWENRVSHVLKHEMVHASQLHFLDLIFMAFVGVLLWFNPFVFLLLRSVRENHEYLADDQARREPGSLAAYLACLRDETIRRYSPAVASYFKSSTIKKRIIMLTNHHTKSHKRWLYLSVLPLAALLLLAFQTPEVSESTVSGEIPSMFPLPEKHSDGFTTHYAHLNEFRVDAGDKVTLGEVLATVGSTGRSTGPHLHFEVRKEGTSLNPEDYY